MMFARIRTNGGLMDDQSACSAYSKPVLTPFGRVTQFTHGSNNGSADGANLGKSKK